MSAKATWQQVHTHHPAILNPYVESYTYVKIRGARMLALCVCSDGYYVRYLTGRKTYLRLNSRNMQRFAERLYASGLLDNYHTLLSPASLFTSG